MARFTSYPNKSKPADSDTLLINDASASANKQILLSGLFAWLRDKFASSTISELETTDKTIVGAINELKEDLDNIEGGGGSGDGLTSEVKDALLAIFQHVAYTNSNGQTYYDALEEALYPTVTTRTVSYSLSHVTSSNNASTVTSGASYTATLTASSGYTINTVTVTMGGADVTSTVYSSGTITIPSVTGNIVITATAVASVSSISATYTQSGTVYTNTNLDSLKSDLVVTATYTGGTTSTIPGTDYTLSGTLTEGTSTITVSYGGKTTTFNVTVTEAEIYSYSYANGDLTKLVASCTYAEGVGAYYTDSTDNKRRTFFSSSGENTLLFKDSQGNYADGEYYPIPIPSDATSVTVSITPNLNYIGVGFYTYDETTGTYTRVYDPGWSQGSYTYTFTAGEWDAITVTSKSRFNVAFTESDEPTELSITFATE